VLYDQHSGSANLLIKRRPTALATASPAAHSDLLSRPNSKADVLEHRIELRCVFAGQAADFYRSGTRRPVSRWFGSAGVFLLFHFEVQV
jgi:hypothetical protein